MKPVNKIKVAIYLRVSTDDQVDKYGLPLQKEAIESYLKSRPRLEDGSVSYEIVKVYSDEGISGTVPLEERPKFSEMIYDIKTAPEGEKPFNVVAAYRIDRFARKLKILLEAVEFFEKHDIGFVSITETIDTTTPFGKAILSIIGVIAELEIETFKERSKGGKAQARKRGVYMGPNAPFGYIKDPESRLFVLPEEAEIVREIFSLWIVQGFSQTGIASELTQRGILTPSASAVKFKKRKGGINKMNDITFWKDDQVKDILQHEIYIGNDYEKIKNGKKLERKDWILVDYKHPSIVSDDIFARAQKRLEESKYQYREKKKTFSENTYILSGLLRCNCCYNPEDGDKERYTFIGNKKKITGDVFSYYYKCGRKSITKTSRECGSLPVPADTLENYIVSFVKALLKDPKLVYDYQNNLVSTKAEVKKDESQLREIEKYLNALPNKKDKIIIQHREGWISDADMEKAMEDIKVQKIGYEAKRKEIQDRVSKNTLSEGYLKTFDLFAQKYSEVLNDLSKNREEIATVLRMIVDSVIVSTRPATGDDRIAGRKKEGQEIPESIHIKLKLPQEIMENLQKEFLVNPSKWWDWRGSNPRPWP